MASRRTAIGVATALVLALFGGVPRASAADVVPSPPQKDRSVPVTPVPVKAPGSDPAAKAAARSAAAIVWPKPDGGDVALPAVGGVRAGALPLRLAAGAAQAPAQRVHVEMLGHDAATRAGMSGLLLRLNRTDGGAGQAKVALSVDYRSFRTAYGGDWASRLTLAAMPACAATTPAVAACRRATALPTKNDAVTGTATAEVPASAAPSVYALAATPSGGAGDYTATSLTPSATWQAGGSAGDFEWSYPLRMPPPPGGSAPDLKLTYSSGAVDGRTSATNNQTSWAGEGFDLWSGYIERKYKSCTDDTAGGGPKTGDECWGTQNATMSLNGTGVDLVRDDATGAWHPKNDDGSRVELLTDTGLGNGDNDGEYWRVTTADGTQYYFGRNRLPGWTAGKPETASTWTVPVFGNDAGEPCHASTFAASWCQQAWRWNLDYVVDRNGNTAAYYYTKELNGYGRDLDATARTEYVRGGTLARVDYGMRQGQEYAANAPERAVFDVADRCLPGTTCTSAQPQNWPDVPWDQDCAAAPCTGKLTPTFWSTKRLAKVTTQVWSGSAYRDVDSWTFTHSYPDPGDGTAKSLWLASIGHSGLVGGAATVPDVTFQGVQMANRVDGLDGEPPLNKYRVFQINSETGDALVVQYSAADCARSALPTPDSNTRRCYPAWWTPPNEASMLDWFQKYVVVAVAENDLTGGGTQKTTQYSYGGAPAWHYDDDELTPPSRRTWSDWRGYAQITVTKGASGQAQASSSELYFRGMDGDKLSSGTRHASVTDSRGTAVTDSAALRGFLRERIDYTTPGGGELDGTINDPWVSSPTATRTRDGITTTAAYTEVGKAVTRTALSGGGHRTTETDTSYDDKGQPVQVSDLGDTGTANDDRCTRTTYARGETAWLLALPSRIETVGVACSADATYPDDLISDTRTYYDGATSLTAAPVHGDPTRVEVAGSWSDGAPVYVTTARTAYDDYGRTVESYDALGHKTTTAYTPASGGPATETVTTNPLGQADTAELDPAWGLPTAQIDANGERTDLAYDPLGRLTQVWMPGRAKATQTPNVTFGYTVRNDGPAVVTSGLLQNDGSYKTTYKLYDALLRERQTQAPAPGGGRLITDTTYDSRGLVAARTSPFYNDAAPGNTLVTTGANQIPGRTVTTYDGLDRPLIQAFQALGVERWRTTTFYGGDHVDVTPPAGGTATSTYTDARGNPTKLLQYKGGTPSGVYDTTAYTYTKAGNMATVTAPGGAVTSAAYDLRGRKLKTVQPDQGTTTYTYDDLGQTTSATDARGKTVAYVYDALGRKTAERDGSPTGTLLADWVYDTLAKGKLTSATRYVGGNAYTQATTGYNNAYQPTGTSVTIPAAEGVLAGAYTSSTTYNTDGTVASSTMPAAGGLPAETLTYRYDALGDLTTMSSGLGTYVYDMTYTKYGETSQRTLGTRGKRVWQTYYYEEGTRRPQTAITERETATGVQQGRATYGYDPAGDVTSIADTPTGLPADVQCFRYDYLQRLTDAWTASAGCSAAPVQSAIDGPAPYWTSYTYDAAGNRLSQVQHTTSGAATQTYGYDPDQPHTLTSVKTAGSTTATYSYDKSGNTTGRSQSGTSQTLDYDSYGRLAKVTAGTSVTSYAYDADGDRLLRRDPSGTTLYLAGTEVRATTAGAVTATRYYGHGSTTIASRTPSAVTWLSGDAHGTPQFAINATTLDTVNRRLTPFGEARGPAVTWPGEKGFVGGTTDTSTGLIHLGAREYDPATGRFTSGDPVADPGDPQQLQGYSYAAANPATSADPSGTYACGARSADDLCPGQGNGGGGAPPTAQDDYDQTRETYFDDSKMLPGSVRVHKHTGAKAPGNGIIVARTFISGSEAAYGILQGDDRDFSLDPNAEYRMAVAWDTDTGEVTYTVEASCPVGSCDMKNSPYKQDKITDNGANRMNVTHEGDGSLSVDISGLNSFLPCCAVNAQIAIRIDPRHVTVSLDGDDYPSFEVNQYRQGVAPRSLARDGATGPFGDRGEWDLDGTKGQIGLGGTNSLPMMPNRHAFWVDGKRTTEDQYLFDNTRETKPPL